ncbi:DUF1566 domain-containing protein [Maridesulfovibrio sp.]|uniref:Lcl C-terminal domain-containing protein n=1 Tax=Maridesulfovibrio sp. TaxID=2795000 RepID=UPI002AA738F3|nr:DUF1566 domain-containing protein [Maridesulfovibrio sp.]
MKIHSLLIILTALSLVTTSAWAGNYPVVDSGQGACFDNSRQIHCPDNGSNFYGQDAQYEGNQPHYKDNGDGTISDLVTGLMWIKQRGPAVSWQQAMDGAKDCRVGGYTDWRAPSIKELYSLIDFNGWVQRTEKDSVPFINTDYFEFKFGDNSKGQRIIDCQDWSATTYVDTTMGGAPTAFGVNFADGRIKGYPKQNHRGRSNRYIRYVRSNPEYGKNTFVDLENGSVEDKATGLIWQQQDSIEKLNWEQALNYCEKLDYAGRNDWRLPNVKELQSIVDYTRSPKTSGTAAIDPIFKVTDRESYYWSSTTHLDGPKPSHASYVAFGRAMGCFGPMGSNNKSWMDVHGAGAQRSDPKSGTPDAYPNGHGPQGDDIRIYNYVRCVAGGGVKTYDPPYTRIPSWKGGPAYNETFGMGNSNNGRQRMGRHQDMNYGMGMGQGRGSGKHQGPPQEAFTACNAKSQGDGCSFQTPHGRLSGLCMNRGDKLFCVPEGHGQGGMRGRPMQ